MSLKNEQHVQDELLSTSLRTILDMASIARDSSTQGGLKVFYSHLEYHCVRLQALSKQSKAGSSDLLNHVHERILSYLGCLINGNELNKQDLDDRFKTLEAINFQWCRLSHLEPENRLHFATRSLCPGDTHNRQILDKALLECADDLESLCGAQIVDSIIDKPSAPDIGEPPFVISKATKRLHTALMNCIACKCLTSHEYDAKFELGTYRKSKGSVSRSRTRPSRARPTADRSGINMSDYDFDLFLSFEQNEWHEVCVKTMKDSKITFITPGEDQPCRADPSCSGPSLMTRVDELCGPVKKKKRPDSHRVVLKLEREDLFELGAEASPFRMDKDAEPISLHQCFEMRHDHFNEKTKRILFVILASATLHLTNTPWLQPGWTSHHIKFFQDTSRKTPLRPFIQIQLPRDSHIDRGSQPDAQGYNGNGRDDVETTYMNELVEHCCPTLISLAAILMEVYWARPFSRIAEQQDIMLPKVPGARMNYIDVVQVYEGSTHKTSRTESVRDRMPEDSAVRTVIDSCLDAELWETDDGMPLDSFSLKSKMYQHVVQPLEVYLSKGFSQIRLDSIDSYAWGLDLGNWGQAVILDDPRLHQPETAESKQVSLEAVLSERVRAPVFMPFPTPIQSHHGADSGLLALNLRPHPISNPHITSKAFQFLDDEPNNQEFVTRSNVKKYRSWKLEHIRVQKRFAGNGASSSPAVKIAILDTGIDSEHPLFTAREENIQGKYNCIGQLDLEIGDTHGHGTFAASLILDYARECELYVIKICDEANTTPDAKVVAKAINYAVNMWGVDIISMSFGWPSSDFDGHELIQAAIDSAYNSKVLMFAAASNNGGRSGRAYPASNPHVICVHATDTDGCASGFSPTAELNALNIATVGECIESAWPEALCSDTNPLQSRSGTSYATPILAGIAAFLLQYSHLHLEAEEALELKRKDRMEALLKRCAEKGPNYQPRDGYYYVALSLHKHNLFGGTVEDINYEIRKLLTA